MSSVVKEGYLTKRAVRGVGSNRRRWITLRENSIEWSERQGSKPLGSMELDGETEVVVDSVTEITVEGLVSQYGRKTLSLIADDASDMQEWYQYIAACNGEYDGDDDAPLESDDDEPAPPPPPPPQPKRQSSARQPGVMKCCGDGDCVCAGKSAAEVTNMFKRGLYAEQALFIASKVPVTKDTVGEDINGAIVLVNEVQTGKAEIGAGATGKKMKETGHPYVPGTNYASKLYMPIVFDDHVLTADEVERPDAFRHFANTTKMGCLVLAGDPKYFQRWAMHPQCKEEVSKIAPGRLWAYVKPPPLFFLFRSRLHELQATFAQFSRNLDASGSMGVEAWERFTREAALVTRSLDVTRLDGFFEECCVTSKTGERLGDGGGGDVYGNREAAEAQKWFRAAGPARYESPAPMRSGVR